MKIHLEWAWCISVAICHVIHTDEIVFNGRLTPQHPIVCENQDITFHCQLLDDPLPERKLRFVVKSPPRSDVIVNESDVIRENLTSAHFTLRPSRVGFMHVNCYYGQPSDFRNRSLRIGKSILFSIFTMPREIQNMQCVVENYETMFCSWEHGTDYHTDKMPNVTFEWRKSDTTEWHNCPELKNNGTLCIWPGINRNTSDDVLQSTLDIRIIQVQVCGESVSSNFTIKPKLLVKPNPITDLRSHVINSTCIRLQWNKYAMHEPGVTHEYRIWINSIWSMNESPVIIRDTQPANVMNRLLCDLEEDTKYTFSVEQKPDNEGFWSKSVTTENRTLKDVPGASPKLIPGGYYWNPKECSDGDKMRTVCLSWQNINAIDMNAEMKGIDINFTRIGSYEPEVRKTFSEDTTYGCARLMCNVTYTVIVGARNKLGISQWQSTIIVQRWQSSFHQPTFTIEMAKRSTNVKAYVFIQFELPQTGTTDIFVTWCSKSFGQCANDKVIKWMRLPPNVTHAHIHTERAESYLYSVSMADNDTSYGSRWEHCIYTRGVAPKVYPNNLSVVTGSEDNTLEVIWEKTGCKSGEPIISAYRVKYCHAVSEKCSIKEVPSNKSRLVLQDLLEDEEYTVQIKGLSAQNLPGPYSPAKSGTPKNNSLKLGQIVGISIGVFIMVVLATIGILCSLGILRERILQWKKKLSGVKLPENLDFDLSPSNLNDRKPSTDSGIPTTPTPLCTNDTSIT